MQGSAWIGVLQRIPQNLHDSLALGLVTGDEVVVQQLIRLEEDFVVIRGRMSGSTAEGRVMLVPYAYMTLVAFTRRMMEPEVQALFGAASTNPLAAFEAPAVNQTAAYEAAPEPTSAAAAPAAAPPPPAPPSPTPAPPAANPAAPRSSDAPKPPPSKSILLARLRERLAERAK